jgi:hypothetical protein
MGILEELTVGQKWVVVLTGLTLALAAGNLGRAIVALRYAFILPELSTTAPLGYFAALGGFWGAVFIACSVGLSRFRDWGRWSALAAAALYQANVWVNHILFDASDYARQVVPRNLVLTGILLLIFWGSLNLPAVRRAFRAVEDGKARSKKRNR